MKRDIPQSPQGSLLGRAAFSMLSGRISRKAAAALRHYTPYTRSVLQPVLSAAHHKLKKHCPLIMPEIVPARGARQRLLVDVSTTFYMRQVSGIQRTVRSLVSALKRNADKFDLEPVPVRLHRENYVLRLVAARGFPEQIEIEGDEPLYGGDHVLMLDSTWDIYDKWAQIFPAIRNSGGKVVTCVYDILPITHPEYFPKNTQRMFGPWFRMACAESDALLSISKATQDDIARQGVAVARDFFHLGADFVPSASDDSNATRTAANFLMVGTIEPRKGHETVLEAFETLWRNGETPRLTFVGRPGWKMNKLIRKMRGLSKKQPLFEFVEGATDQQLLASYGRADVIIAASVAEGFGLPIVEALMKGKRIIASDIPAFREIAGDAPDYFRVSDSADLASVVLRLTRHPSVRRTLPKWLSWDESAEQLMMKIKQITSDHHCRQEG